MKVRFLDHRRTRRIIDRRRARARPRGRLSEGTVQGGILAFIGDGSCPVVPDDPSLGRGWVRVGKAELSEGDKEFVARHAIEFGFCYDPVDGFATPNSVHFLQIKLVFWRTGS